MNYIEVTITFSENDPWKEIFTTLLADIGFDSFMDGDSEELLAYIPENIYDKQQLDSLLTHHGFSVDVSYKSAKIESQDWNAVWESNYAPVMIGERCYIRAPFHEPKPDVPFEIVIEPKMSFGTAHHETTAMMIEYMLETDVERKSLLDMGAGTGVLAILARKKGASPVVAIDNDEWAYNNNIENNSKNSIDDMTVILGDAATIPDRQFDIIFANINRNILYNDIPFYANVLKTGGMLFLSGFYVEQDLEILRNRCAEFGIEFLDNKEKNHWAAARFGKK
ncbi:50S ribosomal protein L11 methyltransferase [Bacteroidales bacterium OttesenSCG-928-B11]|nr:50S ribosomal protein L11 methyltransferase [Bacteroidales bacterium OttesenSCG-928-E04]MDL2312607.1 50S ribosomal protein L11 methyltransferase [Bacteroidales bacterium OttesenSCG-928-B11]